MGERSLERGHLLDEEMRVVLRGIPEDCLLAATTLTFFAEVTKRGSVISFIS